MATTTQDELYRTFLTISGQQTSALSDVGTTLADVLAQVNEMRAAIPAPNVKTPATSTASQAQSGGGDILSSVASSVLKSGFGLAPVVTGLLSLFGGGDQSVPAPLVKYALPPTVSFQAAESGSGVTGMDYDQSGMPRVYGGGSTGSSPANPGTYTPPAAGDGTRQSPQITVNVQAMDARSFLDRSNDIAMAVRDAMLNMNAINDVVNEL